MDRNQQGAMANMGAMQQGAMNQFNPAMAQSERHRRIRPDHWWPDHAGLVFW